MDQLNFGGAVIPAMAGFFFGKRAKVQEVRVEKTQLPAVINEIPGETGVTRYLMAVPVVSGVSKYLKKKDKEAMSSVAVYLLRQKIAEKTVPQQTGVAKYLVKAGKETTRAKTCVDKYLLKQEMAQPKFSSLTGVARYQAEQDLIARKQAAAALTQKYKEQEAAIQLAKQAEKEAGMQFSEEQIHEAEASLVAEAAAATGVGRYLQQTEKSTAKPSTGVARYIAQQIINDSQKPVLSKVGLYLRDQAVKENKKPKLTGVAKYLSKLPPVTEKPVTARPKLTTTGVSKYLETQQTAEPGKTVLTGVAKYLDKKSNEEASQIKKLEDLSLRETLEPEFKPVEGEFIPANSFYADTGVSRYLEKINKTADTVTADFARPLTGVAKYLQQQKGPDRDVQLSAPTGVDRYLLRKAS
ncbi:MAG: hypothetical protein FJ190_05010 [Gammaproteobacteria bacterium]|nr:hypothetical protein [Gammaproteobacteria bacterium]